MILTNCRLVPELCEGFQEEFADIRIEGDSIAEILPAGGRYAGEEVLDCSGRTVLPGLHNLHCHSDKYGLAINNPMQAREVARKQLTDGADFIKILGSSVAGEDRDDSCLLYPDELDALEEVARREHTYISVHTNTKESVLLAVERENYSIEHGNMLDQECIDAFVRHGFKSKLVTTAHVSAIFGGDELVKIANGMHKDAAEAGVLVGWGTDAMEDIFLAEPGAEFRLREKVIGFNKIDVLKQATINSAIINQDDQNVGTIKVGKKADLAIFDGKPDEDFDVFNRPCAYVVRNGVLVVDHGRVKCI